MVGIIVISESKAATEMLKTVRKVLGKKSLKGMTSLVIKSDFSARTLKSKINKLIKQMDAKQGTLILSELYGSTQSNVCLDFIQNGHIELVCGYNLPMLIKAATVNHNGSLSKVATQVRNAGKKYIKRIR